MPRTAKLMIAPDGPLTYRANGGLVFEKGRVYPVDAEVGRRFDGHPDFTVQWDPDPVPVVQPPAAAVDLHLMIDTSKAQAVVAEALANLAPSAAPAAAAPKARASKPKGGR